MEIKLSKTAVEAIRKNGILYGEISQELKVKPSSLIRILQENDKRLTQAGVIAIIKKHKPDMQDSEILEEIPNELQAA